MHIQFDVTFKVVPRIFIQLFTIFIEFNGNTPLALHILMTRKTEKLYTAALFSNRELIPSFIPVFATCDFELAPRNSFKANLSFSNDHWVLVSLYKSFMKKLKN